MGDPFCCDQRWREPRGAASGALEVEISPVSMAEHGGYSVALDPLNASLDEEARMAAWVDQSLPALTEKFLMLKRAGENPSR
ncbi:hypothetical protein [Brevundimonas diminuta]|uniref:hypothetical protein n=1 Tax=Brevundimonas diminuta TaxID=293 RepID=UPI0035DF0A78